jgi:hypothetical protein
MRNIFLADFMDYSAEKPVAAAISKRCARPAGGIA